MRELRQDEISQVNGGNPWGAAAAGGFVVGAVTSGFSAYTSGASLRTTLTAATLGGLAGATGGVATVTTGAIRAVNTIRTIGYGIAANSVTASGQGESDVGDTEKVLEK